MKKILSVLLAASCLLGLVACGGSADGGSAATPTAGDSDAVAEAAVGEGTASGDVTDITFYTYNMTGAQQEGVEAMIEEFHAANPDINVEVIYALSTELNTKIQADIAAGVTPDLIQVTFDAMDFAVNNFGVQDLSDIAPAAELEEHLAGFSQAALSVAEMDGHLYGLPYTFSTPMLFYNATLFEEAGLDPDSPPTTWDEVAEYSLQITQNTDAEGFVFGATTANDWALQGLIKSNGGAVMSEDRSTILFGEEEAVGAIQMLQDMHKSGAHADMDDTQAWEAFPAGNLGMMLTTAAMQAYMLMGAEAAGWELRTAKMPSFTGQEAVPVNSGSGLFVCSTDTEKQQAAWRLIQFATSDRGYTIITTMMGYPPLRPGIVEDADYLKDWAEENPLVQPNLEQIEVVTPWEAYPGSNWQQIETILMDALNKCLFSDVDVEETMRAAQEQAQSLMP